jgi:HEAT repeat protein
LKQAIGIFLVILSALAAGCASRERTLERLRTDNPRVQAATIAEVARAGDPSMVPELINLLDAQDEGVRFMAAAGLHRLTGQNFGCQFAKPGERQALVAKWRQWWASQQKGEPAQQG